MSAGSTGRSPENCVCPPPRDGEIAAQPAANASAPVTNRMAMRIIAAQSARDGVAGER
jgi:hypothetical protein